MTLFSLGKLQHEWVEKKTSWHCITSRDNVYHSLGALKKANLTQTYGEEFLRGTKMLKYISVTIKHRVIVNSMTEVWHV